MEKINIQKIVESWSPAVEQLSKGAVKGGSDRMEWICQLAHNQKMHALYEGAEAVAVNGYWYIKTPYISNPNGTTFNVNNNQADAPAAYICK